MSRDHWKRLVQPLVHRQSQRLTSVLAAGRDWWQARRRLAIDRAALRALSERERNDLALGDGEAEHWLVQAAPGRAQPEAHIGVGVPVIRSIWTNLRRAMATS